MIERLEHSDARAMASARADRELDPRFEPSLEAHLATCDECGAYASRVEALSQLAQGLPAARARPGLEQRVLAQARARARPARRAARRTLAGIAAALAIAMVVVVVAPENRFRLPRATAAEALTRIRTLYAERRIVEGARPENRRTIRERVWFRTPGYVRIERRYTGAGAEVLASVTIRVPGRRYVVERRARGAKTETLETDVAPSLADLFPEPLSSSVAGSGVDAGPGPVIAGRATRKLVIETGPLATRTVYVDAGRYAVLRAEESVVLGKTTFAKGGEIVRTVETSVVRYNRSMADGLFAIPRDVPAQAVGFAARPHDALRIAPVSMPERFRVVQAGRDAARNEAILLARGGFPILVTNDAVPEFDADVHRRVRVGGLDGILRVDLYEPPRLSFTTARGAITIAAPLPASALADLAAQMYAVPAE